MTALASRPGPVPAAERHRSPWGQRQFWLVQASVLAIALLHDVVLVRMQAQELLWGIPSPLTSTLLIVPVIYSALTFGVAGAVSTTLWAGVLIVPHWVVLHIHPLSVSHLWIEVTNLSVILAVAIVVGRRVEVERLAAHRAEVARATASVAEARYRGLFENQPSPVIVVDPGGTVVELNAAATAALGPQAVGRPLHEFLPDVISGASTGAVVRITHGPDRLYAPTISSVTVAGGRVLEQIVLTDVTDQQARQLEQRAFNGRLIAVEEDERRRLAEELHDDPLQQLMYLMRTLDELAQDERLDEGLAHSVRDGRRVAQDAGGAIRKIIHGLRPPVLDDLGLIPAVRQLIKQSQQRAAIEIGLQVQGPQRRLPRDVELTAYRVIQESLNNVLRHSHASCASVVIDFGDVPTVTIRDDGVGLNGSPEPAVGEGLGLIGMRERVARVGGTLHVSSVEGQGAIIRAELPVDIPKTPLEPGG